MERADAVAAHRQLLEVLDQPLILGLQVVADGSHRAEEDSKKEGLDQQDQMGWVSAKRLEGPLAAGFEKTQVEDVDERRDEESPEGSQP